ACDPDNRLIAAQLEKSWEAALRRVETCQARLEAVRTPEPAIVTPDFTGLADDLDAAWNAPGVTMRTRQRLLRALVTDIIADVDDATREVVLTALVQMAAADQLHWRAELAEVVDGQAEGGSGAVRGSPLRPRSHHPVRALVSSVQAQSARLGRDDGRARPVDGAYDDHALGAALCPGVRETLAPVCPGGRPVMAGRRDLRQDPRRVALPISFR